MGTYTYYYLYFIYNRPILIFYYNKTAIIANNKILWRVLVRMHAAAQRSSYHIWTNYQNRKCRKLCDKKYEYIYFILIFCTEEEAMEFVVKVAAISGGAELGKQSMHLHAPMFWWFHSVKMGFHFLHILQI